MTAPSGGTEIGAGFGLWHPELVDMAVIASTTACRGILPLPEQRIGIDPPNLPPDTRTGESERAS
jgi:hypothetical protein